MQTDNEADTNVANKKTVIRLFNFPRINNSGLPVKIEPFVGYAIMLAAACQGRFSDRIRMIKND
jgi:hypothetical protein